MVGRFGVVLVRLYRSHVLKTLALHPPFDRVEHQMLHVLRVDQSIRSDLLCEPDREPPCAGADVGNCGSVGDPDRVHDLVGLLPDGAVRPLEQSEIHRGKQTSMTRWRRRRWRLGRKAGLKTRLYEQDGGRDRDNVAAEVVAPAVVAAGP